MLFGTNALTAVLLGAVTGTGGGVMRDVLLNMAVSVLFAIGVGIGFVLIIIPGLFLMTIWAVVAPVTVLERPGIFEAFGCSRELVRGNGWNVFGVIVIM